ncbi:isocitrate lyase/PEP mutase family protein [Streptomyces sp. NBC_00576]|uniref:isocitrate lyase/PEP mutase family protein n=1 Tax=Streptomyces sp. NBC_00576 TaxID=2903665 RepID=UPI002E7FC0F5|nr:isocitrate lyase/PEP mutase family protein [Streptomyces sp. NBC_00576]WUB75511.1 isocitrate lyase/PEP mutase family protein [Streptomyces sp. NBC_00576]
MATTLKQAIEANKPLAVPSVYDGISALLIRELGFEAAYLGSYATGATMYGLPDIGYIGLEDMADQVRRLAPIVDVPIIVDGEGGWGNPLHAAHAVRVLERAGAAGTHIDDHIFGKHMKAPVDLETTQRTADKIKASVDARSSEDFMVIGRTDASKPGASADVQLAAVERMLAYQEAGADGVFIAGILDEERWALLKAEARVPVFTVDFPGRSAAEVGSWGADVVLYRALGPLAAAHALRTAFQTLIREGSTTSIESELDTMPDFDKFLGVEQARDDARAYGLLDD